MAAVLTRWRSTSTPPSLEKTHNSPVKITFPFSFYLTERQELKSRIIQFDMATSIAKPSFPLLCKSACKS
ncbi:hypothetical protein OUZ56_023322 [Daphnia magna]|uniref:Uncharacterized protein n=1 Tax=Daphnia magna TaxID=35525 RepID=A0ABR0AYZ2_9CRUS|nr:hypothetical protein OUZ56_023322 [Daphnia magna]